MGYVTGGIDADDKGYEEMRGPGTGVGTAYAGGGYGGDGGYGSTVPPAAHAAPRMDRPSILQAGTGGERQGLGQGGRRYPAQRQRGCRDSRTAHCARLLRFCDP